MRRRSRVTRHGRLETWGLRSSFVAPRRTVFNPPAAGSPRRRRLRANVLAPAEVDPSRSHPVLYLLHGRSDAYDHWIHPDAGAAADVARELDAFIVMPEGARGWYTDWWN